jgi:hypothetical protein
MDLSAKPFPNRDSGKEWEQELRSLQTEAREAQGGQADEGQRRGSSAEATSPVSDPAPTPPSSAQIPLVTQPQTDKTGLAENTKGKNINGRMLETLQKDASCVDWSARKWADHLGCSVSTVQGTTAWKNILTTRLLQKTDAINRRGDGRRIDRRRFGKKKPSDRE